MNGKNVQNVLMNQKNLIMKCKKKKKKQFFINYIKCKV